MKEQISRFLEHAEDALDDASYLHQDGRVLAVANREFGWPLDAFWDSASQIITK